MSYLYEFVRYLFLLSILLLAGCGDSSDDRKPAINASGTWIGIFAEDVYPHEVELTVSQDSDDILRGHGIVHGHYGSVIGSANSGGTHMRFESYDTITCCLPLFGCYSKEYMLLEFFGEPQGSTLVDSNAFLDYGCNIPALQYPLTLYRQ